MGRGKPTCFFRLRKSWEDRPFQGYRLFRGHPENLCEAGGGENPDWAIEEADGGWKGKIDKRTGRMTRE
jgi:hypothetical protein